VLDVHRLRVLAAVARHGSMTAAARALRYTQPSISHHLARLETETGSRLVQRVGRGVRLTEAGRVLAGRAEEILARLDAAEAELDAHTGLAAGRVRLAAFPSALGTFVPVAAAGFAADHPDVELRLTEAEPAGAGALLRSGEVDVGVLFDHPGSPPDHDDGLRRIPLLAEQLHLVAPVGLAGDDPADHAGRRWISGCERCRGHLVRSCAAAGFTPDIAFTTDDYVAVQALVAAGLGVTVLPALALAAARHPGVRAVALPGERREVFAAVHGAAPDPPPTAALLAHLVRAAAGVPLPG
jgi:DNA-binding transcriptional LysR family regulator